MKLRPIPEATETRCVFRFEIAHHIGNWDQFQHMGIPCWKSPMLLDDPFEPEMEGYDP